MFLLNFLVNGLFTHKESVRWLLAFWVCFFSIYFLLRACGMRIILQVYKYIAILVSAFCILQQASSILGIAFFYDLSWLGVESRVTFAGPFLRVTAFFAEPAHLGFFLMYPTFIAIINKRLLSDFIIIIAFVMTFSVGSFGMLIILLIGYYLFIDKRITVKSFLILMIVLTGFILLLNFIPEFSHKFNSLFVGGDALLLSENRSKAAPYFLVFVNLSSFLDSPFFGNGFGTRLVIYELYLSDILGNVKNPDQFISNEVFFAKIMGEMGAIGLITFFYIIYKRWSKASEQNKIFLFLFLVVSLKSGSYFNPALLFFLNMYFIKKL